MLVGQAVRQLDRRAVHEVARVRARSRSRHRPSCGRSATKLLSDSTSSDALADGLDGIDLELPGIDLRARPAGEEQARERTQDHAQPLASAHVLRISVCGRGRGGARLLRPADERFALRRRSAARRDAASGSTRAPCRRSRDRLARSRRASATGCRGRPRSRPSSRSSGACRPSSTSRWMIHEAGATAVYHGHAVSLEWQS